jgi:hypothetical protein
MAHQPGLHHELVLIDQPQLRHLSSGCIFDGRADGGEFFCFCQSSLQPGGAPFLAEFALSVGPQDLEGAGEEKTRLFLARLEDIGMAGRSGLSTSLTGLLAAFNSGMGLGC